MNLLMFVRATQMVEGSRTSLPGSISERSKAHGGFNSILRSTIKPLVDKKIRMH